MNRRVVAAALLPVLLSSCVVRPAFVPRPSGIYQRFTALTEPRVELPVGALWVTGYGPSGPGAAADNLVTERSLSGITFDNDLQLSFTAGLLKFFDLDPSIRNKVTARLADMSIVRVRDLAALPGPAGQPRLYEAVKVGTVTITTTRDVGLDIQSHALAQGLAVIERGSTGAIRTYTIEGRDIFFAYRLARFLTTSGERQHLDVLPDRGWHVRLDGADIAFAPEATRTLANTCSAPSGQLTSNGVPITDVAAGASDRPKPLPVPISDGRGGLYDALLVRWDATRARRSSCRVRVTLQLTGHRLETLRDPQPSF